MRNMGLWDWVILLAVVSAVVGAIWALRRNKNKGCHGDCGSCPHCKH